MSLYVKGATTAKGWLSRKYYLSPEAVALLEAHCHNTPLTMSAFLDMLIKRELDPKPNRPGGPPAEVPPMTHTDIRAEKPVMPSTKELQRRQLEKMQQPTKKDFKLDV